MELDGDDIDPSGPGLPAILLNQMFQDPRQPLPFGLGYRCLGRWHTLPMPPCLHLDDDDAPAGLFAEQVGLAEAGYQVPPQHPQSLAAQEPGSRTLTPRPELVASSGAHLGFPLAARIEPVDRNEQQLIADGAHVREAGLLV